jgi:hypothetical protein
VDIEAVPDSLAVAGLGRRSGAALLAVGKDTLQKWAVSIRALPVGDPGLSDKEKRGGIFCERGEREALGLRAWLGGVGPQKAKRGGGGRTLESGFLAFVFDLIISLGEGFRAKSMRLLPRRFCEQSDHFALIHGWRGWCGLDECSRGRPATWRSDRRHRMGGSPGLTADMRLMPLLWMMRPSRTPKSAWG